MKIACARSYFAMSVLTALLMCVGCDDDNEDPQNKFSIENQGFQTDCCQRDYSAKITGLSPSGGQYLFAALMAGDTIAIHGDSVFVPAGPYIDVEVGVRVAYHDQVPAGDYELQVMSCNSADGTGKMNMVTNASSVEIVQVPEYTWDLCKECYQIEIRYRTFIACPLVRLIPYLNLIQCSVDDFELQRWYEGDNRDFQWLGGTSRSFQLVNVYYDLVSLSWSMDYTSHFGISRRYSADSVRATGDNCVAEPSGQHQCQGQAQHGDPNGSNLSATWLYNTPDSVAIKIDVDGYPPCHIPQVNWNPCGIDGHFVFHFRIDRSQGYPNPQYRYSFRHDGFPWHECYINSYKVPGTEWTPTGGIGDILKLCGNWIFCEDDGELEVVEEEWKDVPLSL